MRLPERKKNRLPDFDYSTPNAYFVTICSENRRNVFWTDMTAIVDCPENAPLSLSGRIAAEYLDKINRRFPTVLVDRYVVMPNHIHILLRIEPVGEAFRLPEDGTGNPSPTLGNVIGWYKYQVTKQINAVRNMPGERVLQRSYYDHVVRNEADFQDIWLYIEGNPSKMAEDPICKATE